MKEQYRYLLMENDIPAAWYNINADMPADIGPILHPVTKEPVNAEFLAELFPRRFITELLSKDRWIEIPGPVRDIYKIWRPSPLVRARRLEKVLDTPAHIYYKFEGVSPVGSHKPNTSIPRLSMRKKRA